MMKCERGRRGVRSGLTAGGDAGCVCVCVFGGRGKGGGGGGVGTSWELRCTE
jgi:hypothetical protein